MKCKLIDQFGHVRYCASLDDKYIPRVFQTVAAAKSAARHWNGSGTVINVVPATDEEIHDYELSKMARTFHLISNPFLLS